MTDFAERLYSWLPGLYRDKDTTEELRRFLEITAGPLAGTEASIEQLHEDFYANTCRDEFIALIGSLLGIEGDPRLPAWAQRAELGNALQSYRTKGIAEPLERVTREFTGMSVSTLDFSQAVALLPFVQEANPLITRRNRAVAENPPGSGNFFFRTDRSLVQLYDGTRGRRITRQFLAGREAEFTGVDGGFSIEERGTDIFTRAESRYTVVAADLTDFSNPKTPGGTALAISANQVAIDPELGRFLILPPVPLAGNVTVDYQELEPESFSRESFDIRDPGRMERLGRPDDPAPYTVDIRSPRRPEDRIGRMHFDNHGFFFTPGRVMTHHRPILLKMGPPEWFSFDSRPLAPGDTKGAELQLQDGLDGSPLTRSKLAGREAEFCGAPRGFTILIRGVNLLDSGFEPKVNVRTADLSDLNAPKDRFGSAMALAATDIAVDPQLGRFILDLGALGASVEQVRVNYLLGPVVSVNGSTPGHPHAAIPELFSFSASGQPAPLRDTVDGALITAKLRLGVPAAEFHGRPRGWTIQRNGADVSGALTASIQPLDSPNAPVAAGSIAIDPDRGWFKFPPGALAPGDAVTVDFGYEDTSAQEQILASLAQRLPRMLPAGVSAVIIDNRKRPIQPAVLA